MRFHPISFLLGLGAASLVPVLARVFRPLVVEAAAAGMAAWEETRRVVAEQMEVMEDIVAEARARRETMPLETNGDLSEHAPSEPSPTGRARRRANAGSRRSSGEHAAV